MMSAAVIIMLVNLFRLQPMVINDDLAAAAQTRAEYLCERDQWSHDGLSASFTGFHYGYAGENLARNFRDEYGVLSGWLRSESHRSNMLNGRFKVVGVGKSCNIVVMFLAEKYEKYTP